MNLLLIDDSEEDQEFLKFLLEKQDQIQVNLHVASDGKSALKFLSQESPDLILLDLYLPDMSGQEVYEVIQKKKIPTALVTGGVQEDELLIRDFKGVVGILRKPYNLEEILLLIMRK